MLDKNLLLVDIGGTNIRYAYSNIGDSGFVSENKAELDRLNDFDNLMSELLAESDVKNIDKTCQRSMNYHTGTGTGK